VNKREAASRLKTLSPRAQKLYARIEAGAWYDYTSAPRAMAELIAAGLVYGCVRVKSLISGFRLYDAKPMKEVY